MYILHSAVVWAIVFSCFNFVYTERLNEYISDFHPLSYDVNQVHENHLRSKRSAGQNDVLHLKLHAFNRKLSLRLRRDSSAFSPDVTVVIDGKEQEPDLSHLYTGHVLGDRKSFVHGALIEGRFEGHIDLSDGTGYHVEHSGVFFDTKQKFHSVVYRDADFSMEDFKRLQKRSVSGDISKQINCGLSSQTIEHELEIEQKAVIPDSELTGDKEPEFLQEGHYDGTRASKYQKPTMKEKKRAVGGSGEAKTCSLFMQGDPQLWKHYNDLLSSATNRDVAVRDAITSLFNNHVTTANRIYRNTAFTHSSHGGNTERGRGYSFRINRVLITSIVNCEGPFCDPAIGVTNFLNINSYMNHDLFCLAYVFTYRDFEDGILGLAWKASPGASVGGICARNSRVRQENGPVVQKSLNTGIMSILNYGRRVSQAVSQITFAHETGHNFGSDHDSGACEGSASQGNYIMYARATSGNLPNNEKFSPCSTRSMADVIYAVENNINGHRNCFIASDAAWCGNSVKEGDEECDCGYEEDGNCDCCIGQDSQGENPLACKRKPVTDVGGSVLCDPSEGPCCGSRCTFINGGMCNPGGDCHGSASCDGRNASCPEPQHHDPNTPCSANTQVCLNGECQGSICDRIVGDQGEVFRACFPVGQGQCHIACSANNGTCWSSLLHAEPGFPVEFKRLLDQLANASNSDKSIPVQPSYPCNDPPQGYCDTLLRCRAVNADGPLAKLKNLFFSPKSIETVRNWVTEYWWAVMLMILGLITFMALFIKFCAVHTPSSNPNKKAHRKLSNTLTIRRRPRDAAAAHRVPPGGQPRSQGPPPARQNREDDEIQLALAMSLSENEARSSKVDNPPAYPGTSASNVPQNYRRPESRGDKKGRGMEMKQMKV